MSLTFAYVPRFIGVSVFASAQSFLMVRSAAVVRKHYSASATRAQKSLTETDATVSPIAFVIPTINFGEGDAEQYDLSQHYSSLIPVGQTVTDVSLIAGSLPSGVTLNEGNESLDYDGVGAITSVSGLVIRVTTA
jgi:hypothetical protein